jgi:hypothetical protein
VTGSPFGKKKKLSWSPGGHKFRSKKKEVATDYLKTSNADIGIANGEMDAFFCEHTFI